MPHNPEFSSAGRHQAGAAEQADVGFEALRRELGPSETIRRAFFSAPLTVTGAHPQRLDAEYRAWELLRFASLLPHMPFDEELAAEGWYSKAFREHSDRGLVALEAKEKSPSDELAAFHKLNEMGIYSQADFYLPSKAAQHHYTNELAKHLGPDPKRIRSQLTHPAELERIDRRERTKAERDAKRRELQGSDGSSSGDSGTGPADPAEGQKGKDSQGRGGGPGMGKKNRRSRR